MVIADEVYGHLTFGNTPFVPMGVFGSIVPVLTLGSISKRWIVPGWRIGWLVTSDPHGILQKSGVGSLSLFPFLRVYELALFHYVGIEWLCDHGSKPFVLLSQRTSFEICIFHHRINNYVCFS